MRIIVDFGRDEPMIGLNSSGQSGNPASPHYADGIEAWLKGQYMSFPFKSENLDKVYGTQRRSEERTSELQSLMRISYAVFCLKKKKKKITTKTTSNERY